MVGSLQSEVSIEFRYDEERKRTVLSRRKAGGLCHLGKAYWEDPVLCLQIVNPTAGLLARDELAMSIDIQEKAKVALTSPSACRFHTMPDGQAELTQSFNVGQGAWLDYWPETVIPQRGSSVKQRTIINLEDESQMVFVENLTPGRIAHGENQEFRKLDSSIEIYHRRELLVKERCFLEPSAGHWPLSVPGWETCHYASIWIAGKNPDEVLAECVAMVEDPTAEYLGGVTVLDSELAVLRVVAPDNLILRRLLKNLRATLKRSIPLLNTNFRKL